MTRRLEVSIEGTVQGVGFRPYIYGLASRYKLSGYVRNTPRGLLLEIEGKDQGINKFLIHLRASPPPLARIEKIFHRELPTRGSSSFKIKKSRIALTRSVFISPDITPCPECLRELFSSKNRRYLYPFINCTNCGPRFTIIQDVPYDRSRTTMERFELCPKCREEYRNPLNRRFHAQPNACPSCGPEVELVQSLASRQYRIQNGVKGREAIAKAIELLSRGEIIAIKGLGGFHLACDATNDEAVSRLRARKYREDKPFALMARGIQTIRRYCEVSDEEARLLCSSERPIVLLKKALSPKSEVPISEYVAPMQNYLGFMLPYTPLHYLLFHLRTPSSQFPSILVLTSGNISDEPIAYENSDALARLSGIADYFLLHNRDIYMRCDDSVARVYEKRPLMLRRSRGYVPQPFRLPFTLRKEILACGAQLKNTFSLGKGDYVFLSHHIGDMENVQTLKSFEQGIEHFKRVFDIEPRIIAYDMHPDYLSTEYAKNYCSLLTAHCSLASIQHHHAHIASCLADNGVESGEVIGVAFDGTGYGEDGAVWGGEFLVAGYKSYRRKAHLKYIPLWGGEKAVKEPWRMGLVYLYTVFGEKLWNLDIDFISSVPGKHWPSVKKILDKGINSPLTSSMGRLFDGVSSILGICLHNNYEGQAAVELEQRGARREKRGASRYRYNVEREGDILVIDPELVIKGIVKDLKRGVSISLISLKFHNTISHLICSICQKIKEESGLEDVALSGGVFQNILLLETTVKQLRQLGFRVYTHQRIPPNDGGISLGQLLIANDRIYE